MGEHLRRKWAALTDFTEDLRGWSGDEELTRLINSSQRLLSQLGLKPQLAKPPAPRLVEYTAALPDGDSA
jgi:hypothetical protein